MHFIYPDDSAAEKEFFTGIFTELLELLGRPFHTPTFDFSDQRYFQTLYATGERLSNMKELRDSKKARGMKHALYINRTYFGLYNILNELGATVRTKSFVPSWR